MAEYIKARKTLDVTTEACAWIAQLETGDLTHEDMTAFREWMARSPAHAKEIKRLAYLSDSMNVLTEMATPLKDAASRQKDIIKDTNKNRHGPVWYAALSVYIFLAFFAGSFLFTQYNAPTEPTYITTAIGSYREVNLPDGTLVKLNTDSAIEIDYSPERRKVRLIRGEAFFQVAHNPDRPFIVYADGKAVRAVGTAFVVRNLQQKFEVIVTEGKVELKRVPVITATVQSNNVTEDRLMTDSTDPIASIIQLKAGESVELNDASPDNVVEIISKREIKRKLSWQEGLLEFSDTPLQEVIEDLTRYTEFQIEIADPEISTMKFGGIFRVNEPQALFEALEQKFDVKVEFISDDVLRLSLIKDNNV